MEYRLGEEKDLDQICELVSGAIENMEAHGIHQWDEFYPLREDFAEDISKQTLYVVSEGEELIALYVISDESDEAYQSAVWENPDGTAYILHRFCVSPKEQNRGIGKQLLLHIEQQVKAMGYESIRLDTFVENPFAQRLYRHNGYEPRGYADWRKGRFDLMEKKL